MGLLKKPGEGESAASQTVLALQSEVKELKDALQQKEMETLKGFIASLSNQISDLRTQMATQGKIESRYGLMDKSAGILDNQLTGARGDLKEIAHMILDAGGPGTRAKSPEDRAKISRGLKDAVKLEERAHALENKLLFGTSKN